MEQSYPGTLTAAINYYAMTDNSLSQLQKDIYVYFCFQVNYEDYFNHPIEKEDKLLNCMKHFNLELDEFVHEITPLINKNYLDMENFEPNIDYIPPGVQKQGLYELLGKEMYEKQFGTEEEE